MMLYILVKQINRKLEYFSLQPILKIYLYFVCLPASLPALRPGCARCRALEILHDKGNGGGFTKILFRRRFTHCVMAIPFIFLSSSLFLFIPLARCESHIRTGFCLSRHVNKLGLHVI